MSAELRTNFGFLASTESYKELERCAIKVQNNKQTWVMKANAQTKHDVAISTDWNDGLRGCWLLCACVGHNQMSFEFLQVLY